MAASQRIGVLCIFVSCVLFSVVVAQNGFHDLQGDYCKTRRVNCCPGRDDQCTVPILGTLCYCDVFCNETASDCCPDFWNVCLGIPPPQYHERCYHQGIYYNHDESAIINCNKCTCVNHPPGSKNVQFRCETDTCIIQPDLLENVNYGRYGWRASNYSMFWGKKLEDGLLKRLGTLQPQDSVQNMLPIRFIYDPSTLPRTFDSRTKWRGLIRRIRDQGWCGCSWAFSTTAVASDRLAIQSEGRENVDLSPQNLVSCNKRGQRGCTGGHLDRAWNYMRRYGVVNEGCYRYESGETMEPGQCRIPRRANLFQLRCGGNQQQTFYRRDLYKMQPAYRVGSRGRREHDIMYEIQENGPTQATMRVYADFFMYRGGVYQPTDLAKQTRPAYHSVRIVGWGEDTSQGHPVKYWHVANSWGNRWGEDGYFRILRGNNECDIENFVIGVGARTARQSFAGGRRFRDRNRRRNELHFNTPQKK